jgi:hypothetical protein
MERIERCQFDRCISSKPMSQAPRTHRAGRTGQVALSLIALACVYWSWLGRHDDTSSRPRQAVEARAEPASRTALVAEFSKHESTPLEAMQAEPPETGEELLSGVVTDATGGPIAGVRLEARGDALDVPWFVACASAVDGRFELRTPAGAGVLRASADGYAISKQAIVAPDQGLHVQLAPSARIVGQVVNALDGHALAGIEVNAGDTLLLLAAVSSAVAISDDHGRFVIDGLAAGNYRIIARSAHWFGQNASPVAVRIGDTAGDVKLALQPAVSVRGQVLVAPQDAPCRVGRAILSSPRPAAYASSATILEAGRVEFQGVPAGAYRIEIECEDGVSGAESPAVHVGANDLDLVWKVQAGARLLGRVVDRLGRGIAQRSVQASGALESDANRMPPRAARSDERGQFELSGLGVGRYRIGLQDSPSVKQELEVSNAALASVTLVVRDNGSIRVQLIGREPGQLDTFRVSALRTAVTQQDQDNQEQLTAQRIGAGLFELNDLREGSYALYANDGRNPALTRNLTLPADQQVSLSWQIAPQDGALQGRVVDAKGEPVSDAWVRITHGESPIPIVGGTQAVLTQLDGHFSLEHLDRSATYDVEAHRPPHATVVVRSLKPGQLAVLTLPVEAD